MNGIGFLLVLAAYVGLCCLVWRIQDRRAHRRNVREQLRIARRYKAAAPPPFDREDTADVIPFPAYGYSVKVPDPDGRYGWRVDGGVA